MIRYVEVPFENVEKLRKEYGNKFLVLTNMNFSEHRVWDKSGVLRAVCDTYQESLEQTTRFMKELVGEEYDVMGSFHFPYRRGEVDESQFRYR